MLLVTGITGHTGKYFLQQLINSEYKGKVRCLVRGNNNAEFIARNKLDIEIVTGDLKDDNCLDIITKDVDTIMHIYNIRYSVNLAEAAIRNNVKRMIAVHTTGMYSKFKRSSSDYIKIEENLLNITKSKIILTILRPTMIYGDMNDRNISRFIKWISTMKVFPLINAGKGLIQPVNARDLGRAYFQVLLKPDVTANKQYNLSGREPISIRYALQTISKMLKKNTVFIPVPISISVLSAYLIKIATLGNIDYIEKVLRFGEDRVFDHSKAKEDFGFDPVSFDKGLELQINQFEQMND